jgi:predicted RNase H-like HicB family nuclease
MLADCGEGGWYGGAVSREPRPYTLAVVVEPDRGMWHAYCPTLLDYGAATWGATREEALGHIREVVAMVVERMVEEGVPVPVTPADHGPASGERIVVAVGVPAPRGRLPPEPRGARGDGWARGDAAAFAGWRGPLATR